jgi:ATP-dependent helicase Lhr and Lhr-like helicase
VPPPYPVHVLVQQLLALPRQEGTLGRWTWMDRLGGTLVLGDEVREDADLLIGHLLSTGMLRLDGEMLQLGPEAERRHGRRNYLDLTAVFADPPTLAVAHGRTVVGQVHVRSLLRRQDDDEATSLLIAGRDWTIETVRLEATRRPRHPRNRQTGPAELDRGRPRYLRRARPRHPTGPRRS